MDEHVKNAVSFFRHVILDELAFVKCWVAGGAVRDYFSIGKIQSDVDVFFPDEGSFQAADLKMDELGSLVHRDSNAVLYRLGNTEIHLISKRYFSTPLETIEEFDFTFQTSIKQWQGQSFLLLDIQVKNVPQRPVSSF